VAEAIRLMFEYRDGAFVPLAPKNVRMVAPHPPATRDETPTEGRFVELRGADGVAVRSIRVGESGPPMAEFPTGDPNKPFGRTEPPPGAILSVVIESDKRATHAALVDVAAPSDRRERGFEKHDLAVVPLPGGDGQ